MVSPDIQMRIELVNGFYSFQLDLSWLAKYSDNTIAVNTDHLYQRYVEQNEQPRARWYLDDGRHA